VWGRPPSAVQAEQGSAGFVLRPPLRSSATVKPAPKLILPEIFTTLAVAPGNALNLHFRNKAAKFAQRSKNKISFPGRCTNSGHPLVERLHFIACKRFKSPRFLLTIKMRRVKQTRSLTRSEVYLVGAASGARARSPRKHRKMSSGRASKGL
jgi:hypothetical protein